MLCRHLFVAASLIQFLKADEDQCVQCSCNDSQHDEYFLPRVELQCSEIYHHVCQPWNSERGKGPQVLVPANILHFSLIYTHANKQLGSKHGLTLPGRPSET